MSSLRFHIRRVAGPIIRPVLLLVLRVVSERTAMHGIEVWSGTGKDANALERINAALQLVRDHDRVRYLRIQRHVRRFVILEIEDATQLPDVQICVLGVRMVNTIPVPRLAATMVHEATHARIRAAGVPLRPAILRREEILCTHEAIAFLERVPGAEAESQRLEALLAKELESDRPWFEKTLE